MSIKEYLLAALIGIIISLIAIVAISAMCLWIMPTVHANETECLKVNNAVEMAQLTANYIDNGKLPWYSKLVCEKTGANE